MKLVGRAKMLRIHFGEDDQWQGRRSTRPSSSAAASWILPAPPFPRGIEGYGTSTMIRAVLHLFRLSSDAPILVQIIDSAENSRRHDRRWDGLPDEVFATSPTASLTSSKASTAW